MMSGTYIKLSIFFFGLIAIGIASLILFQVFGIGLTCQYKLINGVECKSCGLTRGLSECIKGNFEAANTFNPQSILWMYFLTVQLLFRPFVIVYYWIQPLSFKRQLKKIIILDVFILLVFTLTLIINHG
ncbi:MAG: hypothetical protein COB15_06660 [Flavobacteriales bacterium]|nr:MAG: hypothetical protein COB15_06660 [Flavobacteriales bacterium]